jgi:hypothetical protein
VPVAKPTEHGFVLGSEGILPLPDFTFWRLFRYGFWAFQKSKAAILYEEVKTNQD